jgi:hypothetical protein
MRSVMVRYQVKPGQAELNEQLVRAVYEELRQAKPDGFRYGTFRLADGVTFVHLAFSTGNDNPLTEIEAFGKFQQGIADRCDVPPAVTELTEVGSYELFS